MGKRNKITVNVVRKRKMLGSIAVQLNYTDNPTVGPAFATTVKIADAQ